jgi:alpha-N-acetylglucosaminidase
MKRILTFVMACMLSIGIFADDVSTFKGLVARLLPDFSSSIIAKKLPSGSEDYFRISSQDGKIEIAGNNANSMAVGLNYYLKYYCQL